MALSPSALAKGRTANDQFDRHYAEKIWDLIPEIYRHEDGIADYPGQLRALVEIIAKQAAHQRRSIDRLLADSRIFQADDWAIAYIGDLLGTRLLDPRNSAGRRADVGKTLTYRRRSGTARLLETLASDAADWDTVAHEGFKHLARHPHKWERHFINGTITGTPRGGYPNIRSPRVGDTAYGPFEDTSHYPAVRSAERGKPVYGIADVTLHCFRKYAYKLESVTPWELDATHFTLDPSGRGHVPLYQPGRERNDDCLIPREWNIRQPITCRRLGDARYMLPDGAQLADSSFLPLVGRTFHTADDLATAGVDAGVADIEGLLDMCLLVDSPKAQLLDNARSEVPAIRVTIAGVQPRLEQVATAGLESWADGVTPTPGTLVMIDPARGLVQLPNAAELDAHLLYYGTYWPIGAGTYERIGRMPDTPSPPPNILDPVAPDLATLEGERAVETSTTYRPATNAIKVAEVAHLYAIDQQRPYILFQNASAAVEIRPVTTGSLIDGEHTLELSGLWIGIEATGGSERAELRIAGNWQRVVLRDLTLDPGGIRAALPGDVPEPIAHIDLVIEGRVKEMVIDNCVIGSIRHQDEALGDDLPCGDARIVICDSIIKGHGDQPAIDLLGADVEMDRCTVFGNARMTRADISDSIIDGVLNVQDAQNSCLRFSMARSGGRIPSPYESLIRPEGLPGGSFESRRFGDPGFGMLTNCAPEKVRMGAEGALEMGAFNRALFPVKQSDLLTKLAEFAPVQANVHLVLET